MRSIVFVILASSLLGCAALFEKGFPEFPQDKIKSEHIVTITDGKVECFRQDITSYFPRKFAKPVQVDLLECDGVSGLRPHESVIVDNWMDDVYEWAKARTCKIK